jgi:hypothetical protein
MNRSLQKPVRKTIERDEEGIGHWLKQTWPAASTTVVTKYLGAERHVFGSGRTVREIGAAFANQTKAGDVPGFASRATATERADGGFRLR